MNDCSRNPTVPAVATVGGVSVSAWWFVPPALYWFWVWAYVAQEWWTNPEYHFGLLVPFLAAFLFWRERLWQPAVADRPRPRSGRAWMLLALLLLFLGELIRPHAIVYSRAASWFLTLGAVSMTAGVWLHFRGATACKRLLPVLLLLCLAVPLPDTLWGALSLFLKNWVTQWTTDFLNALGIAARHEGNILITARGSLGIDDACSGLRSLQASLVSGVFLGLLLLRGRFHRLFMLAASVALVLTANVMRTTFLAWQMHRLGEAGVKNLHDPAGASLLLVNMIGIALLGVWLVQREKRFPPPPAPPAPALNLEWTLNRGAAGPMACAGLILFTALIPNLRSQWQRPSGDGLLGLRPQPVQGFRIARRPTDLWANQLRFDMAEDHDFVSYDGSDLGIFHATWLAGKVSNQFVGQHLPAICFQNTGWSVTGPAFVRPLALRGRGYPVLWQGFRQGQESVLAGYLHLVGGQARVFRPGEAGWFSWRTLVWDIRHGKPADQEVFIFTVSGANGLDPAWRDMLELLKQRYP